MIKIAKPFLIATILLLCLSCSSENDSLDTIVIPEPEGENPSGEDPAWVPAPPEDAVEIPGFPKSMNKYVGGTLKEQAHYYYAPDGNLLLIRYGYPQLNNAITFSYDSNGKLKSVDSLADVYTFYWEEDRIVRADKYNAVWYGNSEIIYEYNTEGHIIQRAETYLDWTPTLTTKDLFYYDEDGNLKSIENYHNSEQGGDNFKPSSITKFEDYTENENLFLEFEIIPGQRVQHFFPGSQKTWNYNPSQSLYENISFSYKYDEQGRVVEKIFGRNTIVYEYY